MPVYLHFWGGSIEPCLRQDMEQHSLGLPPTQGPLKCGMGAWQGMCRVFNVWLQSWKHAQGLCFVIFSFQSQGWWRFVFTSLEAFPSTICLLIFFPDAYDFCLDSSARSSGIFLIPVLGTNYSSLFACAFQTSLSWGADLWRSNWLSWGSWWGTVQPAGLRFETLT